MAGSSRGTKTSRSAQRRSPMGGALVPIVVVAVAGLLISLVVWQQMRADTQDAEGTSGEEQDSQPEGPDSVDGPEQEDLSGIAQREEDDVLVAGPVDAPVALVMFSDYQCPYCAQWTQDTLPVMMEYAEAGDLRIEIRDVNVYGENSERAARAAYAAGLQGKYWEYHDALFAGGQIRSGKQLSADSLISLAGELGLDTDEFRADMTGADTEETISQNAQLGTDLGVFSTPAFLLGGEPILGAMPTGVFDEAVQDALAKEQ